MICKSCEQETDMLFDKQCPLCWATDDTNRDTDDAGEAIDMMFDVVAKLMRERDEARRFAELLLRRNELADDPLQPPVVPPWSRIVEGG